MSINALAFRFNRKPKAVENKLRRRGLNVVASKMELFSELCISG